jgi:CO/xanthine dehydrogenase Mo-binding subunit
VLAVYLDACSPTYTGPAATAVSATPRPFDWAPSIYLRLDHTGTLTVTAFRSEMGQGFRTALAMVVADDRPEDLGD